MDLRLNELIKMVPENARIADIGTDHAYLPIKLMQLGKIKYAVASDVAKGPLRNAAADIERANLTDKISVRLGNGVTTIRKDDQIDTVIIAGMGGKLICNILSAASTAFPTLVLEPNIGEAMVRRFLMEHNYQISAEKLIATGGHSYELIKAEKVNKKFNLTNDELLFGPIILQKQRQSDVFQKKWHHQLSYYEQLLKNLNKARNKNQERISTIKEIIKQIKGVLI